MTTLQSFNPSTGEAKLVASQLPHKVDGIVAALTPHIKEDDNVQSTFHYGPFGVCAVITPWNFPANMVQWLLIPALMAGNTVVVKPSEHTPLSSQFYLDILKGCLPDGVLQVVQGGKEAAGAIKVVAGDQDSSGMGPMVADFQRQHVIRLLDSAEQQGAERLHGSDSHPPDYVLPTVVRVTDDMDIMREETFGPVSCVRRFTHIDEVIDKINASVYGLGAVIFSADVESAKKLAVKIDAGMVGINKWCAGADETPWVGAKQSGYGYHGGKAGHRQFAQLKIVSTPK